VLARGSEHLGIRAGRLTQLKRGGSDAVAVANLDDANARSVGCLTVQADLSGAHLMSDGVIPVAESGVGDQD